MLPSIGGKKIFWVVIAFIVLFVAAAVKSSPKGDFYFLQAPDVTEALFVGTSRNFVSEDVSISFVEESSIVAVSSPMIFTQSSSLGVAGSLDEDKEIIEYIASENETVSSIASKFGVSVNTILWANKMNSGSVLKVGQKLAILPVTGVIHEVKRGDTVSQIAKEYKAKAEDIVSFNELLDEESIYIGDILIVPNGQMPAPRAPQAAPRPSFAGFIVPVKGVITQGLHWYNAVDIANSCGTPVYAAAGGTIQRTGYHNVGGYYIRILHSNGMVTYYGHLSRILVSPGQTVSQGALIGNMGNTGYTIGATGCHLHFEARGGTNPLANYRVGHRF